MSLVTARASQCRLGMEARYGECLESTEGV
jgi:hypothetical protein